MGKRKGECLGKWKEEKEELTNAQEGRKAEQGRITGRRKEEEGRRKKEGLTMC